MDSDYPASHSMDSRWYAVDQKGQVAMFTSGENGHVPVGAGEVDVLESLWRLRSSPVRGGSEEGEFLHRSFEELTALLGLYYYDYAEDDFDPIVPYKRLVAPRTPLHVDQLPPELREACKKIGFERVNFSERDLLQPLEQFECLFWYMDDRVAYLCSDGKTVRPLPGKEEEFPEFCREFREQAPDQAKDLRFEGCQDEP